MPTWADTLLDAAADAGVGRRLRQRVVGDATPSRERLRAYRLLCWSRLAMGTLLAGWFALRTPAAHAGVLLGTGYVVFAALQLALALRSSRGFAWQILGTVGVDLIGFGAMQFVAGDAAREFVLCYTLPVLAAGLYGTLRFALASSGGVALLLLTQAASAPRGRGDDALLGAAVVGAAYVAVGLLAQALAQRLARQEESARVSEDRAARQLAINRHVLLEHPDGVLVLDAALRVESANPAAGRLLGLRDWELGEGHALATYPGAAELAAALREPGSTPPHALRFAGPDGLRLQARVQPLRQLPGGPAFLVFVQDLRAIGEQLQQEKLAALGRLVAAVAHEIRNPLGAIGQANQLGAEPDLSEAQRSRMRELIEQNVERLNRIVEDVLDLGRGSARTGIELQPLRVLLELQAEVDDGARIDLQADDPAATLNFDAQHLRRVLVNLLGNARRYASAKDGAIRVRLRGSPQVLELGVANDGPLVAPELRAQLFEPFFTTDSRGTGLGLYICQELCARYGASIEYRVRHGGPAGAYGEFVIRQPTRA
jgi:two-component system sensor histidine kinase PilS (NtrC family)